MMNDISPNSANIKTNLVGGYIPVRNIWLLMLYASDLFRFISNTQNKVDFEKRPDELPDLIAEILIHQVELRLKRNLSFGYQARSNILDRVRGRIDLLYTESHQLLHRGKIYCHFEELTNNTIRNRFVLAALEKVSKIVHRKKELVPKCKSLITCLRRMGVIGDCPSRSEISLNCFSRHDQDDRLMIYAAKLVFELALPTESVGKNIIISPEKNIEWMRKLYEKAVFGFYDTVLPKSDWIVRAGKRIYWSIDEQSTGIDEILPSMKTDITLENKINNHRIVIDTKFNSIVTKGWYRETTLRSSYIYQIYAYLRSQEKEGDLLANQATGMFLHPSINSQINESAVIQGHKICFVTVDLNAKGIEIRDQLQKIISNLNQFSQD